MKRYGFTLARLFVLIALVGLGTGGVLVAQSLTRSADVRHLMADTEQAMTAVNLFRDKYQQLPGDFDNAISIWGRDTRCPDAEGNSGEARAPGTCNGDNNGLIESTTMMPATTSEVFQMWRHLALAGLVQGDFTGLSGGNYAECIIGFNCPRLSMSDATAMATDFNWQGTGTNGWWGTKSAGTGNWLVLGAPGNGLSWPHVPLLSAKEQANIDIKQDDGKPGTGKVMAMGCQLYQSGCMVGPDGNSVVPLDCDSFAAVAQYQTSKPGTICTPMFRMTERSSAPIHQ